ncbi:MAG: HAMP domain-containing sensor histidine kinase [Chloroflexi bacterium]|nr:HAMP domain-containing sensor histidine kinase [Chloroflexota bacterium]
MTTDPQTRITELEEALRHAEWQAQSAVRAKEAFMANISHELHTPLSAILGFAELLREDARHGRFDSVAHDLDKIVQAGVQLLSRINELLDLSKIEAHTVSLRSVRFDLGQELERILTDLRPLMQHQGNHFELTLGQRDMVGDPDKIRQILHNLLDNANKFTAAGAIALRVAPYAQNGVAGVQFVVQDTGIGMTAVQAQQIFEAFTQVDLSATRHYEGMGIGLYICRQLCQLMGGEINVQTEPGRGSVFTVWLPSG